MRPRSSWYRLLNPLRFLISGGLLAGLIWLADPLAVWDAWKHADAGWLLVAFLVQLVGVAISAAKWGVLLRARGHQQPYRWLLSAYLVGQFANNFLPTTVGGDALRAVQLGRRIGSLSQSSASVFLERLTGFLALSLIANLALLLSLTGLTGTSLVTDVKTSLLTIGFTALAIGAAVVSFTAPWLQQIIGPYLPAALRQRVGRVAQALADYFPQGHSLVLVLVMSLLFQSIWIAMHVVCGRALGIEAPLLLYALMVPLSDILGLLPIFLNNVGAREIIFTFYLTQVGVSLAAALALAFMAFTIRLLASTPGGLVLLFGGADLRAG